MRNTRDSRQRPDYTCAFFAHGFCARLSPLCVNASSNYFWPRQLSEADVGYVRALSPESPFLWCMCMYVSSVCVRRAKIL